MPRTSSSPARLSPAIPLGVLVLSLACPWLEGLIPLGIIVHVLLLWSAWNDRGAIFGRIALAWVFISLGCLPIAVSFYSSDGSISLGLGGWELAGFIFLRASTAFASLQLLWQIVPFYELCRRMRHLGIPPLLIDLFELSYRYIFILQETGGNIREAQLSRLGYSNGYWRSLEEIRLLASQTFVLSMSWADLSYDGLLSRGFDDEQTSETEETTEPSLASAPIVCLEGIGYKYPDGKQALSGVSLKIQEGERIVLLGENGAGKSTLMRLLSGITTRQTGRIILMGRELSTSHKDMKCLRSRVSLVFQNSNYQLFCPSVEDEIAFGLRNIGLDEKETIQRTEEVIELFDLDELRYLPPHRLSEGQKKWVSLAAIIAINPKVLLLDEPTASLDRAYTRRVLSLLERLHREGKTIILSTHDMDLAYQWAERVLVMHQGSLIADESKEVVFSNPEVLEQANLERPFQLKQSHEKRNIHPLKPTQDKSSADFDLALYHKTSEMRALIVGGGIGALRKAKTLVTSGVRTMVIAPEIVSELKALLESSGADYEERPLKIGEDISAYTIVVGATQERELEEYLCVQAQTNGQLFCTLTAPLRGNIQFPAQGTRGGIHLAVRSHYSLPEITRAMRDNFLQQIPDLSEKLQRLSQLRQKSKESRSPEDIHNYSEMRDQILKQLNK